MDGIKLPWFVWEVDLDDSPCTTAQSQEVFNISSHVSFYVGPFIKSSDDLLKKIRMTLCGIPKDLLTVITKTIALKFQSSPSISVQTVVRAAQCMAQTYNKWAEI